MNLAQKLGLAATLSASAFFSGCVTQDGKVSLNPDDYSKAERVGYLGVALGGAANVLGATGNTQAAIGTGMVAQAANLHAQREIVKDQIQTNTSSQTVVNTLHNNPDYVLIGDTSSGGLAYRHKESGKMFVVDSTGQYETK